MEGEFARLLSRHRRAAGLTQEVLAESAKMSVAAVSALERGIRRFPRRETVAALANTLGLNADDQRIFALAARRRPGHDDQAAAQLTGQRISAVPRQLPLVVAGFTGRGAELGQLRAVLTGESSQPAVIAVTGMGGVGKTTLAVQAAHAVAGEYPDGQVYLDLQGYGTGDAVPPVDALSYLLRAFGLPGPEVPVRVDEAAARLRTLLADRRALILLDNARDGNHIESLLPGIGRSGVIITSRHDMSGISTARALRLGLLSRSEALDLLRTIAGTSRVDREPDAAQSILDACGLLPLALRIVAGRLAGRPRWPLSHLADLLRDERSRLDQLEHFDLGVRASFEVSIDNLTGSEIVGEQLAATVFTLFGVPDVPDLTVEVAASLLDRDRQSTAMTLEYLCDLHLVESLSPGRYRLHDLLRMYAKERAQFGITSQSRAGAITRILDLYAAAAWQAIEFASPNASRLSWLRAQPPYSSRGPKFEDLGSVLAWLDGQRPHLVALMAQAAETAGVPAGSTLRLAIGLNTFYATRGHWQDCLRINQRALKIAIAANDNHAQGFIRNDLGLVLFDLVQAGSGDADESVAQLHRSLDLFEHLDDYQGAAMALANLSHVLDHTGDHQQAIDYGECALSIYQKLDDVLAQALALVNIGNSQGKLGKTDEQRVSYNTSIEISTRFGGDHILAIALLGSGVAYRKAGRFTPSLDHLHQSAAKFVDLNDRLGLAESLDELGVTYRLAGRADAAIELHEEALEIAVHYDDGRRHVLILHHLGLALEDSGDTVGAATRLQEAHALGTRRQLPNLAGLQKALLRLTAAE